MDLKEFFLLQLEQEVAATEKTIERLPEGKNSWKPHEKSMELATLAAHIVSIPEWAAITVESEELNLDESSSQEYKDKMPSTKEGLLAQLKEGAQKARKALAETNEAELMKIWRMKMSGQLILEKPRYEVLAHDILAHLAHHRGQLTVYLRLNNASVPAIFGPSADEQS